MLRQTMTRLVTGIALLCASLAWGGYTFLHTVGDPHRAERIAESILESPDARAEIASPLTDQIVETIDLPNEQKAQITAAIADVLGDPAIVGNFIAAFGSAQANALGVPDARPTTIDAGALVNAVRDRLAQSYPQLAAQIPTSTATVDLPKVENPFISRARQLADTWTTYLALTAAVLLIGMLVVGDRRRVLRSYGVWAIITGAFWAIGPRIAPWIARQSAPDADAVVGATVDAVSGTMTAIATIMVISGIIALVVRYGVLGERRSAEQYAPYPDAGAPYAPVHHAPAAPQQAGPTYGYGMTRTDQVPTHGQAAPGQQAHPAQAYQQQPYQAQTYPQQTTPAEPYQTPYATTMTQPAHSTPIDAVIDAQRPGAIPLVIRPLDLPNSSDLLAPLHRDSDDPS